MQLSVIIPVYNVKDYLARCVKSVVTECKGLEYEALLIDDGSTDGSATLCDELSTLYTDVKVFHKPNGGLSDARNYGVDYANGEYVFYLDSDDYLVEDGLKKEIEAAKTFGSDVVCGNFYYKYPQHVMLFNTIPYETQVFNGGEDAISILIDGKYYQNFAWGKLIRRDLAEQYLFPKGKLFEDIYWFHRILHQANHVTVINQPVVYYEQRDNSISFDYKLRSLDILDGYKERLRFLEANYPLLVDKHKLLMAQNCIEQAWMICKNLNGRDYNTGIKKLRNIVISCALQDNPLLDDLHKKKLQMVMKNMTMYKYHVVIEKIIYKLKGK